MTRFLTSFLAGIFWSLASAAASTQTYVLAPDRLFDGEAMREGWRVRVEDGRIAAAGPQVSEAGAEVIDLSGMTLTPGLIDAHSHVLLHPYDETSWDDQVLRESVAERSARAVNHLKATLDAGFTTLRDLGSEGAGYADVGLRQALEKGVIEGPRLIVAGPAIIATGVYGPKGFHEGVTVPKGAVEVSGIPNLIEETRRQLGGGADWIKVYADYGWGPTGEPRPTFSVDELKAIVETAKAAGAPVVAHAGTDEGMRRTIEAGVETIEHGDRGTLETYRLMARKGVAICPTLGAVEANMRYRGWDGDPATAPTRITDKHTQMERILRAGTPLCNGSDVGVFDHGDNAWELELMVDYGVTPLASLKAATSGNAKILRLEDEIGAVKPGLIADLAAFAGDPSTDISALRNVQFVMQGGKIIKQP
ncbi:amidohydrolase family protein [Hyphococcus sp.]|uniref:metal-dependent hydrolase family protein n=1 Tax=Hyphococcus sp. TaxID=2038636 RepID=UPI003D135D92